MAEVPIAHWNVVPHRDIVGSFSPGVVAFDRQQVAYCAFRLNGVGEWFQQPTVQQNPNSGTWEYYLTLPGGIPNGNYFLQAAAVATPTKFKSLPNLTVNIFATAATYTTFYVNADSGSDSGAGTSGDPFLTVKRALEALSGNGNGGRIYLQNATATYAVATPSVVATTATRYVNIELAPGGTKANVVVSSWQDIGSTKVRIAGITVSATINGTGVLWLDDVHLKGAGQLVSIGASGWISGWTSAYFTSGEVSDCLEALSGFALTRGATITNVGGYGWRGATNQAIIDSTISTSTYGLGWISTGAMDNVLVFDVSALNVTRAAIDVHDASLSTMSNVAFVNVLTEGGLTSQIRDVSPNHMVMWNCSFTTSPFTWACTIPVALSVIQCDFKRMLAAAGDVAAKPTMESVDSAFLDCHYQDTTGQALLLGASATIGNPGYTDAAADDYTPATGSPLYDSHVAPRLVRCDVEKVSRADPTTVGALKGADEGSGTAGAEPSGLVYSPAQTKTNIGATLTPITPTYDGYVEKFEVVPSIYHIYQPPAEIPCDPADAHFHVRPWTASDGVLGSGGHHPYVVEDLRHSVVYLKKPGDPDGDAFCPLALAINLSGPYANDHAGVSHPGPWPAERPVIKVTGDLYSATGDFSAPLLGHSIALPGLNRRLVAWAGMPGLGGFPPLSGSASGKGAQVVVSIVGATGQAQDTVGGCQIGQGLLNTDGSWDETFAPIDVLWKDLTIRPLESSSTKGSITGEWTWRSGRHRFYDCSFQPKLPITTQAFAGWNVYSHFRCNVAAHWDLRRNKGSHAQEHFFYVDNINGGLLRDAGGKGPDSWFIDNELPEGTGRSMCQFVDRPYNYLISGSKSNPTPTTASLPGGKGVVLMRRNIVRKGSDSGTTYFTGVSGARMTFIFDGNRIIQDFPIDPGPPPKGAPITKPTGEVVYVINHARGLIVEGSGNDGTRLNDNGYTAHRAVVIDHYDLTSTPNEKRMSFRGVEEVHIYSFQHLIDIGSPRPDIGLDDQDGAAFPPFYMGSCNEQFNADGLLVYSATGGFGTPKSKNGTQMPNVGSLNLYMGYPNDPTAYSGWLPNGTKMSGAIFSAGDTTHGPLTNTEINSFAAVPVVLPTGVSISATTGIVSGTPSEGIGYNVATLTPYEPVIDSPGAYVTVGGFPTGYVRIPVKASNASAPDAWTPGEFQLWIQGDIGVPNAGPFTASAYFIPPASIKYDLFVDAPTFVASVVFPDGFQVDQAGDTQTVRPPAFVANATFLFPNATADIDVEPPTFIASATFPGPTVSGASNVTDGPGALVGLRAGFQAMKGV